MSYPDTEIPWHEAPSPHDAKDLCSGGVAPVPLADLKKARDGSKAPLHLVPLWTLEGAARVYEYGNTKYARQNWRAAAQEVKVGGALGNYADAFLRHLSDIQKAGDWAAVDDESGLPHVYHMAAGLQMLIGIGIEGGVLPRDPSQEGEKDGQ